MNVFKRFISLILCLTIIGFIPINAPSAIAADTVAPKADQSEWFFIDPLGDVELYGNEALEQMGEEVAARLTEFAETGEVSQSQATPFSAFGEPIEYYSSGLDMSVYDVVGFATKFTSSSVSSAYEAAAYIMNQIMAGIYTTTFTINTGTASQTSIPLSYGYVIARELGNFVQAYFPHYFYLSGRSNSAQEAGTTYLDSITVTVVPTTFDNYPEDNPNYWGAEYNAAAQFISSYNINSGTGWEKLDKAHKLIAQMVTYSSCCQKGQLANCIFAHKTAVCNGYALATSMLALRMKLNVPYISGNAGGAHAWNLNVWNLSEENPSGVNYSSPDELNEFNNFTKNVLMFDTTWCDRDDPDMPVGCDEEWGGYCKRKLSEEPRTYNSYYLSYIAFVNGIGDEKDYAPGMFFEYMAESIASLIVRSTDGNHEIDLMNETIRLSDGFSVAAYSIDGGNKWKKGPLPTGNKFQNLFNKDLTLWLANKADEKGKNPADDAEIIKFEKINKRPKAKYKPYYKEDSWVFVDSKDKSATPMWVTGGLEYADTNDKGKTPSGGWKPIPEEGFDIRSGKTKTMILMRIAPSAENGFTPASKMMKVKPANYAKAPSLKIKNEAITLKKGFVYAFDSDDGSNFSELLTDKQVLNLTDNNFKNFATLYVKKAVTGKKPESEVQEIKIHTITGATPTSLQ